MRTARWTKTWLLSLPLAAVLAGSLGACAHGRLHRDLNAMHEDFHSRPHTRAEHRRLHEDLDDLHDEAHERGSHGRRYGEWGSYPRGRYDGGWY